MQEKFIFNFENSNVSHAATRAALTESHTPLTAAYWPVRAEFQERNTMIAKSKLFTLIIMAVAACGLLLPVHASAALAGLPVTGTFTDSYGGIGQFVGTFNVQNFGSQGTTLSAIGTLVGTMTDSKGNVLGTVTNANTTMIAAPGTASCSILNLTLGPLQLNLLGLVVNLNEVHLTITAISGPGNLLGNLLCAVANLLNGGVPNIGSLSTLLNRILTAL
jgi:hypothetical protein